MDTYEAMIWGAGALLLVASGIRWGRTARGKDKDQVRCNEAINAFESELERVPESSRDDVYRVLSKFRDVCYTTPDAHVMMTGEIANRNLPAKYQYDPSKSNLF